jgi:hypothetical protein
MPAPKGHPPYPGCEKGGRPKVWTKEKIEAEADAFLEWMKDFKSLWYEDFALSRGYDPDNLSLWAKENEKFAGVYKQSKAWQKSLLVKGGLLGKYNASITKLVLANTAGWTDRQQLSGDSVNPLSFLLQNVDGKSKDLVDEHEE